MRLYIYTDDLDLSTVGWTTDPRDIIAVDGRCFLGAITIPSGLVP